MLNDKLIQNEIYNKKQPVRLFAPKVRANGD